MFAADAALIAKHQDEQALLNAFVKAVADFGLKVNVSKTQWSLSVIQPKYLFINNL